MTPEWLVLAQTAPAVPDLTQFQAGYPWGANLYDEILSIGLVMAAWRVGRRYVMGTFLPEDCSGFDVRETVTTPTRAELATVQAWFVAGVTVTAAAIYLLTGLPWALLWAGAWALCIGGWSLHGTRSSRPVDDVRLLAGARSHGGDDDAV